MTKIFFPIGTLFAKGKPPALGKFGTSREVCALEPSHFILSGSSDDWIDTRRSLGLVRDTWNDPVALLGCGSLKKVGKIRKILTSYINCRIEKHWS